ncbi:MAG: hypothetical protein M3083_01425 [Actinomycetota bacterium]|nr:hypothetical protein [Actinomycetota bacterium]
MADTDGQHQHRQCIEAVASGDVEDGPGLVGVQGIVELGPGTLRGSTRGAA